VGTPDGKRSLGRPISRWEDNIKVHLRETQWRVDSDKWRAVVKAVMNVQVPLNVGNLTSRATISFPTKT
jgi:hypothetical protein